MPLKQSLIWDWANQNIIPADKKTETSGMEQTSFKNNKKDKNYWDDIGRSSYMCAYQTYKIATSDTVYMPS
jgi:hypothetical protein